MKKYCGLVFVIIAMGSRQVNGQNNPAQSFFKSYGLTINAPQANTSQLWNDLNTADRNLSTLLVDPKNDLLYNKTKDLTIHAVQEMGRLSSLNTNASERSKLSAFLLQLNKKAQAVERLRTNNQVPGNPRSSNPASDPAKDKNLQDLSSQLGDALNNQMEDGEKLDRSLLNLGNSESSSENDLQQSSKDILDSLAEVDDKGKEDESQDDKPSGAFNAGVGYSKVLYEDSCLKVVYVLAKKSMIPCFYESQSGSKIVNDDNGSHVEMQTDKVFFPSYHYQSTCLMINKLHKNILIHGFIIGSPHRDAKRHFSCVGDIAQCLSADPEFQNSCANIFYYSWNFGLNVGSFEQSGDFWTEIPNEEPAYNIYYTIIKTP